MSIRMLTKLLKVVIAPKITEIIFYAEEGDGYVTNSDVDYTTAHDAANADSIDTTHDEIAAGISIAIVAGQWSFLRAVIPFDTSSIPPGARIISAILYLYGYASSYVTLDPCNIVIVDGNDCAAALELADYGVLLNKTVAGASMSVADFSTTGYNAFPLNKEGRSWINKGGTTKLAVRSSFDIDEYEEWGNVTFWSADKGFLPDPTAGYKPKLVVQYEHQ